VVARLLWPAVGRSWQLAVAACLAPVAVRLAAGRGPARGAKGSGAFKATSDPPSDKGMDGGGCLGARTRRRQREDRRSMACRTCWLGFQGVPEVRGIGRRTTALGRHGLPREHAPAGSEAEARAAGVACTRERVHGQILLGVPLFELNFLQNSEQELTKL
jgi:hypothetical protein